MVDLADIRRKKKRGKATSRPASDVQPTGSTGAPVEGGGEDNSEVAAEGPPATSGPARKKATRKRKATPKKKATKKAPARKKTTKKRTTKKPAVPQPDEPPIVVSDPTTAIEIPGSATPATAEEFDDSRAASAPAGDLSNAPSAVEAVTSSKPDPALEEVVPPPDDSLVEADSSPSPEPVVASPSIHPPAAIETLIPASEAAAEPQSFGEVASAETGETTPAVEVPMIQQAAPIIPLIDEDLETENHGPIEVLEDRQYLTFMLGDETYAMPIDRIVEIVHHRKTTPVPNADEAVVGILSLRGIVVTILDVRANLGSGPAELSTETRFIVLSLESDTLGLLVDRVLRVSGFSESEIVPPPRLGAMEGGESVRGVVERNGRIIMMLDLERLLETPISEVHR